MFGLYFELGPSHNGHPVEHMGWVGVTGNRRQLGLKVAGIAKGHCMTPASDKSHCGVKASDELEETSRIQIQLLTS